MSLICAFLVARESAFDIQHQLAQVDDMFRSVLATSAANQLIDK